MMPGYGGRSSRTQISKNRQGSTGLARHRSQVTSWLSCPPRHLLPQSRRRVAHPGAEGDSGTRGLSQDWGLSGGAEAKEEK